MSEKFIAEVIIDNIRYIVNIESDTKENAERYIYSFSKIKHGIMSVMIFSAKDLQNADYINRIINSRTITMNTLADMIMSKDDKIIHNNLSKRVSDLKFVLKEIFKDLDDIVNS